jgi:WD40 repeat protein
MTIGAYVPSIGIDFGTTNSSVAWRDPRTGEVEVILNAEGQTKTPSLIYFGEDGVLVGEPVEDLIQEVSTDKARREAVFRSTVASIKRNLLAPPRIALPGGRYVRPVDVVADILKKLKRDAEDGHFHEEVARAVITCPAEFNVLQRKKIEEAGRLAGFAEVALLEEPVAGALAYAHAGLDVGDHVLVYDLGGGTFDLAVLDSEDRSFYVAMEPKGMERVGGDDFDLALYHHCDEVSQQSLGRPISLTSALDLNFLRACRRRKESLTFQERGRFDQYLSSENGPVHFEHEVDRKTFEELIGEYVETSARLTTEILSEADSAGHKVDTVVLIGGSVRIPLVMRTLEETLPVNPLGFDKRDVAVALGAARYTNHLWGAEPVGGISTARATTLVTPPRIERYSEAVQAIRDERLDRAEVDRLKSYARRLGVSAEEAVDIETRLLGGAKEDLLLQRYRKAVEAVWAARRRSRLESVWLGALAGRLGLSPAQSSLVESEVMGGAREKVLGRQATTAPLDDRGDFVPIRTLGGHTGEINSVALSPDGFFLASGASDRTVRIWSARSGRTVGELAGHRGRVDSVAFSPDGRFLASGGFDGSVKVWRLPDGRPVRSLDHPDWVFCVAIAPDSRVLASGGADGEVRLWSLKDGQPLLSLGGHSHWVLSVAFSTDGRLIAGGGADGTVRVWDLDTGETLHGLDHPEQVFSVAFVPDAGLIVTGCGDGSVRVWDPEGAGTLREWAAHSGAALCVVPSYDGRLLFSGGSDGKIKVWDLRIGEPLSILPAHPGGVASIALGSEIRLLLSGGHDREVRLWSKVPGFAERPGRSPVQDPPRPPTLPD